MTNHSAYGDPNITKPLRNDKGSARAFAAGAAALLLFLGLISAPAFGIPVTIAWEVPLVADATYKLEVASDPGFAHIAVQTDAKGTAFFWDAPGEGVYHWRLMRPEQAGGGEANTFVSGTFTVIDPHVKRDKVARLSWKAVAEADGYKIYMLDANDKEHTLITSAPFFVIPKTDVALMIEVVPFTDGHKTARDYHYDPSLVLDTGNPPAAPVPPPPPPQTVVEVQPPAPVPAPAGPPEPPEPARRRVHLVYVFGTVEHERLRAQKLDTDIDSSGTYYGGGAGLWLNPVAGLVLSGQGDYHEHNDRGSSQPSLFPGKTVPMVQSRYTADMEIGYNILDLFGIRTQTLTLSAAAAVVQLPFLPTVFDENAGVPPSFTKKQLTMPGGAASYGYLGSWGSVVAEGGILDDQASDEGKLQFQRLLLEFYPAENLAIELGGFNRSEQGARCAPDTATCLVEGKDRTMAEERGGWLGIGAVFK